jgi:peptidyl-prolyl cis-trans isomerase D
MLETLRKNSRNAVIYVLFGVIIAAFIISFGPGGRGQGGCAPGAGSRVFAARVGSSTLNEQDFRFAYIALGGTQYPAQLARERRLKEFVMDKLIERELLAQEGERLGFKVSQKEVEDMIADGRMLVMGVPRRVDSYVYKDGKFDYDRFKMVAQNQLGVTVLRFIEIERREMLAERVRELLRTSTKVATDEVKDEFEQKGLQVNLEFVRFASRRYEDEAPTAEQIDAYIKTHADELKKQYEERKFLYQKLDKHVKGRSIVVDLAKDADQAAQDAAKKKIEEAAAKVKAGTPFAKVAETYNTDERAKKRGGAFAFRKKGFTGFGDAMDTKLLAATKGAVVGPEKTERGWALVLVEDFREGDVPLEVAQRELAEEGAKREAAKVKAKADAEAALAKIKAGAKLEALYPAAPKKDAKDGAPMMNPMSDAPELKETGLFARRGEMIPELGISKALAKRAFELKPGEVDGPFETSSGSAIARLKERKEPDLADFAKRKDELVRQFERTKWAEVLDAWSKAQCTEAKDDGQIQVNDEILTYEGPGPSKPVKYEPCSGTKPF